MAVGQLFVAMAPLTRLELLAPAKINFFLSVVSRRQTDGFHLIESLIVPVSLYDRIVVEITVTELKPVVVVHSDSPFAPGGPSNLVFRAAQLFIQQAKIANYSVRIAIEKQIPVGSGLGGGSSDAAAVLKGLNRFFGRPFAVEELALLGAQLGADVPALLYGYAAEVSGIGEIVRPLLLAKRLFLVLASDSVALSTREVYSNFDLALTSQADDTRSFRFVSGDFRQNDFANDLEVPASRLHSGIHSMQTRLQSLGAKSTLMSGSGSAVFGLFSTFERAEVAAEALRSQGIWARAVHTLNRSTVEF